MLVKGTVSPMNCGARLLPANGETALCEDTEHKRIQVRLVDEVECLGRIRAELEEGFGRVRR